MYIQRQLVPRLVVLLNLILRSGEAQAAREHQRTLAAVAAAAAASGRPAAAVPAHCMACGSDCAANAEWLGAGGAAAAPMQSQGAVPCPGRLQALQIVVASFRAHLHVAGQLRRVPSGPLGRGASLGARPCHGCSGFQVHNRALQQPNMPKSHARSSLHGAAAQGLQPPLSPAAHLLGTNFMLRRCKPPSPPSAATQLPRAGAADSRALC